MGENGVGKSTLMNILTGLHKSDQGQISINGNETYFSNPKEAEQHGIAFIHQELNIWPEMTVLENLFIGKEISSKLGVLQTRKMKALAKEQFEQTLCLSFSRSRSRRMFCRTAANDRNCKSAYDKCRGNHYG